ncbi:MAG: formate/nitrite transporter family protein [Betaproteobacteria bacterium]|nr:formate/nitrite transporter family protein [Betaproteobacteria bacterium]
MATSLGTDLYSPQEIIDKLENVGVVKANLPFRQMAMLALLAGAFIGFGGLFFVLVTSDPGLPWAMSRLVGGMAFSLGLILVVVAGAELFTGNTFLVMAWAEGRISLNLLLRNWAIVYGANVVGALAMVVLVWLSHHPEMNHGAIADNYVRIAAAKVSAPFGAIFVKGLLCNALVCLAVWLAYAGRSVTDKILAILFPVSAFVAAGFEHCIANFYLIPLGLLLHLVDGVSPAGVAVDGLTVVAAARNIFAATLGNIVGGSVMVAGVYYITFRGAPRGPRA